MTSISIKHEHFDLYNIYTNLPKRVGKKPSKLAVA